MQERPHPEEPREARRLEGWDAGTVLVPSTGRGLPRLTQDEGLLYLLTWMSEWGSTVDGYGLRELK